MIQDIFKSFLCQEFQEVFDTDLNNGLLLHITVKWFDYNNVGFEI